MVIPQQSVSYYSMPLKRILKGFREFRMIILTLIDTCHCLQVTTMISFVLERQGEYRTTIHIEQACRREKGRDKENGRGYPNTARAVMGCNAKEFAGVVKALFVNPNDHL
jgi:hypothetical protein